MATIHLFDITTMSEITKDIIEGTENGTASLRVGKDGEIRVFRFGLDITSNIIFGIDED